MSDVATQVQPNPDNAVQPNAQPETTATPDVNQLLASALWEGKTIDQPETPPADTPPAPPPSGNEPPADPNLPVNTPSADDAETLSVDDYFKREFGLDAAAAKAEWEALRKLKETPPTPQEIQWANDESKRFFELLKEGKEDDVYTFLNQKKQIERLEKYDISNAAQAAEIIKANLQFKYKDLSQQDIDRLFQRQYTMPPMPTQSLDQSDEDYAQSVEAWKKQVQEKEMDMMLDAKLAKPELAQYKSQIVLPDILKAPEPQQQPDQKELEAKNQQFMENFKRALESNYQNFKGFSVTAKDGDVQLPISYNISPEELVASKQMLETFNVNEFLDQRWFDQNGTPNITQMQEDLYLLQNRDKILQSIANEAAAQRYLAHLKVQNNINLSGVNPNLAPPTLEEPKKTESETLAENIWKM